MKFTSNLKTRRLRLLSIVLASAAVNSMAQVLPETSSAAVWRATSRLGYGPTPVLVQAAMPNAKAWSLAQLGEAKQASQRPAQLPAGLQMLAATQAQVSMKYHQENEARRLGQEKARASSPPAEMMAGAGASSTNQAANPPSMADDAENFSRDMVQAATNWRLAACSNPAVENPLLARMTEFWFNHFNVFNGKGPVRPYLGNYLLTAIRPHALGKFENLLLATAQHPAMLLYLDQAQSNVRGLNENYARELMELHTLGVHGGYTQADVRELARMLTGWSVEVRGGQGFIFRPRAHEEGSKSIMGRTFSESGQDQGVAAIQFLAQHPATAQRISERLATFFVADKPSKALVDKLAASFTRSGGDIEVVMRTLIESPEFWEAGNTLFKTPMDYACSSLAAAGVVKDPENDKQNLRQAMGFLAQTGQPVNGWQTPDGYKTDAATWLAPEALTRRADFAFGMAPRIDEPMYLHQFYRNTTRERIAKETASNVRTGLLLAAPEFMSK
jgi:uncharacterized protein (DUF1800 family)